MSDGGSQRRLISTGSPFEREAGYSRAVADGPWCFVSGTTGYDYTTMTMPEDVEAQTRNCLATIAAALAEGLRRRGVPAADASLAAEAGIAVFRVAWEQWMAGEDGRELAAVMTATLNRLAAVTAAE